MDAFELSFLILAITPTVVALIAVPASPSRRRLVIALSLAIPVAGPILAVMVSRVRGTGKLIEPGDMGESVTAPVEIEQVRRLGEMPSLLELLLSESSTDRQAALVVLQSRPDGEAVKMLRWTVDHGRPDAVLDAALALNELDVQFENDLAEAEEAYEEEPTFDHAMKLANTTTVAIESRLVDPAIASDLATRAEKLYQRAPELKGADGRDARVELAELQLLMDKPREAAALLEPVIEQPGANLRSGELIQLYERARFSARQPLFPIRARIRADGSRAVSGVLHPMPARAPESP